MNILIMTNTYLPHVGGVARSVSAFAAEYRRRGHRVLIVAPTFANMPSHEQDVVRVPAVQNFNASDFSVALPVPGFLSRALDNFRPDIVHSQHPFLMGMTAIRIARYRELPLVFTHHTLYEQYTHYVPGDSATLRHFVVELGTRYANLCDLVFAPSDTIRSLLLKRGVTRPVTVVPTGVKVEDFSNGDREGFRRRQGIAADAFVVGHLGRLAPEKNLTFLAEAVADFLLRHHNAVFMVAGTGPCAETIGNIFASRDLGHRLVMLGILEKQALADALHAMDLFAFASKSETQGMVLTEAMAAGLPVVALDASGVREVVRDGINGRLLMQQDHQAFVEALESVARLELTARQQMQSAARLTAEALSLPHTADLALSHFGTLVEANTRRMPEKEVEEWEHLLHLIRAEWDILRGMAESVESALTRDEKSDNGIT
jgi:1,2-diacylglycerol 3-alpha-glucosyltransferase